MNKDELILANQLLETQLKHTSIKLERYRDIVSEYFDSFPDEEKGKIDRRLIEVGE